MRQVPAQYLLIGNGRLARHLQHYFTELSLNFSTWHRSEVLTDLAIKAKAATHILLLISDQAIESFIKTHLAETQALIIHCSGSLITKHAYGAHPLMTFSENLYDFANYLKIPFIIDDHAPPFEKLMPGIPNPHQRLASALKEKYHALCVLSGNFTCLLWQKLFSAFMSELNLSPELAHPYLEQQMKNLLENPTQALTGPLVRNDEHTIKSNLNALHEDPFQEVYQSFVNCYQHIKEVQ